jgi:hypothetical protein
LVIGSTLARQLEGSHLLAGCCEVGARLDNRSSRLARGVEEILLDRPRAKHGIGARRGEVGAAGSLWRR